MNAKINTENHHLHNALECILCDEVHGNQILSPLIRGYTSTFQNYLAETDSLVLLPDVSPIVPGHCLIVTRTHVCSFSQAESDVWHDLIEIKRAAVENLTQFSSGYFFFEHGASSSSNTTGGCIAHAHIHFIPIAINVLHHLIPFSLNPLSISTIEMKSSLPKNDVDYLFYEDMNGCGCVVIDPIKPLPRQFIRMVVANELGLSDWDWRTVFFLDSEIATLSNELSDRGR